MLCNRRVANRTRLSCYLYPSQGCQKHLGPCHTAKVCPALPVCQLPQIRKSKQSPKRQRRWQCRGFLSQAVQLDAKQSCMSGERFRV